MAWPVTFEQIVDARHRLAKLLPVTPLRGYAELDRAVGARVFVKHENHQPTCAFKVRNGVAALTAMSDEQKSRGVVCASTGNHGQGVAWAGRALRVRVTVCVPAGANPEKLLAMRDLGATIVEAGADYDAAVAKMLDIQREQHMTSVHGVNHPMMPVGAGTMTLEIVEQCREMNVTLDTLIVAIGGGSQAVGAMTVLRKLSPNTRVIGVQTTGAPAQHHAWKTGERRVGPPVTTFADGLATRNAYDLTFDALREGLSDFILVTDSQIASAMRLMMRATHNMTEPAGAAGLAAAVALSEKLAGQTIAIVNCCSNVDTTTLRRVICEDG